jgi:rhodanese-related sulfurtransferase
LHSATLDDWLPDPAVRTRHRRRSSADADRLWAAAGAVCLADARTLNRLVRWRIPGTRANQTFRELLADYPFTVLDEGDDWSMSGLCGRIWTLQRDYPRLDGPDDFRAWHEPGTVRVLFAHWVESDHDGSAIVSEARVAPIDRRAAVRLRSLWMVIGVFERLIGGEALELAVQRADR